MNTNYKQFNKSLQNIAYEFGAILEGYIDEANEAEVVTSLLEALPDSTFDAVQPFDAGRLFFACSVYDENVAPFIDDLYRVHLNLPVGEPIEITLNSGGGDVYAGELLIGAIQNIQREGRAVNMTVQGLAASMASIILQVATVRRISPNSSIMLHEVASNSRGKLSAQAEDLEATRKLQDRMFSYYANRTGKSIKYYHDKLLKKDVYLSADEARLEGLVDVVLEPPSYPVTPPIEAKPTPKPRKVVKRG